jgi:choline dehydrogenase-like flavoprotein
MHPFMLLIGDFPERIDGHAGLSSSIYASDFITTDFERPKPDFLLEVAAARPEVCAAMCPGSPEQVQRMVQNYRHLGGVGVVLLDEVSADNRVTLDRFGNARVVYGMSDGDKRRFRQGLVEGAQILFDAGAERVLLPSFEASWDTRGRQGIMSTRADILPMVSGLHFRSNQTPLFAAHMMAGNKLGISPEQSVVSPDYEARGARGLYVVDASVFPGSIGANPMQSIYCIAKIFCDRHLARN